jgi:aminoglycoside 2'-N-acetyltransferase I
MSVEARVTPRKESRVVDVRVAGTDQLSDNQLAPIRALVEDAFEGSFDADDWDHTIGGVHVFVVDDDIAHGSVIERILIAGDRRLRTGYVEGVATARTHRRRGLGSMVMKRVAEVIQADFELGALSTAVQEFYELLGWERWRGPTYVDTPSGRVRTPDEDDGILVLRTAATRALDTTVSLTCDWRPGDVW